MVHHDLHGDGLGLGVRPQPRDLRRRPLGMRQDQDRGEPFDRLRVKRPLAGVPPAAVAPGQQLRVPVLGLGQPALGAGDPCS